MSDSREISIPTLRRVIGNSRGGLKRPHFYRRVQQKHEFPEGLRRCSKQKTLHGNGMDISWNNT